MENFHDTATFYDKIIKYKHLLEKNSFPLSIKTICSYDE